MVSHSPEAAVAVVAELAAAHGLVGHMDSWAVGASEGFASQPVGCRPNCCQQREAAAQGPVEVGSARAHPIVDQEDRLQEHQVGRLEDAHPVAGEHRPDWANHSSADP